MNLKFLRVLHKCVTSITDHKRLNKKQGFGGDGGGWGVNENYNNDSWVDLLGVLP